MTFKDYLKRHGIPSPIPFRIDEAELPDFEKRLGQDAEIRLIKQYRPTIHIRVIFSRDDSLSILSIRNKVGGEAAWLCRDNASLKYLMEQRGALPFKITDEIRALVLALVGIASSSHNQVIPDIDDLIVTYSGVELG